MIWKYYGSQIPLEQYHGVPKGWYAKEIVGEHRRLGGTFDLSGPDATEPGAPSWLPERWEWLQYRKALYRIADGILADDPVCAELAVRYIELRHIGSYSGYLRSLLARRLKHVRLTDGQKLRLHVHFSALVLKQERTDEFKDYMKLWRLIIALPWLEELLVELRKRRNGTAAAEWLLGELKMTAIDAAPSAK